MAAAAVSHPFLVSVLPKLSPLAAAFSVHPAFVNYTKLARQPPLRGRRHLNFTASTFATEAAERTEYDGDVNGGSSLYVGNLPFSVTSDELAELFCEAGSVDSVEVIYDRATKRSRGFAFVTMASSADAGAAISMFDGSLLGGRTMRVNYPEVPRGGEREVLGGPRVVSEVARPRWFVDSPHKVYAGNLGWAVTSQSLHDAFASQPGVLGAKVVFDRDSGRSRGFGFVSFSSPEATEAAIQALDGAELEGRPLRLSVAQSRMTSPSSPEPEPETSISLSSN